MKKVFAFSLIALLYLFAGSGWAHAAPAGTLVYQGRLSDALGNPKNGSFNMELRLYDVATAGSFLWTETQSVAVTDGFYSVTLGDTTPLPPELFAQRLWLGIVVNGDGEMTPRPPLSAAPYAMRALTVMRNVVYVAADGTPTQNGDALQAAMFAIQGNSAQNGYTVFVDAGTFDLGTTTLFVKAYVDLVGQGRERTTIRSAADAPTLQLNNSTGVAALRVLASGPNPNSSSYIPAIDAPEGATGLYLRDLLVDASNPASTQGVRIGIRLGGTHNNRIENTIATATGGEYSYGIRTMASNGRIEGLVMRNVQGIARGAAAGARGIDIGGANDVDVLDVTGRAEGTAASTTQSYVGLRFQTGKKLIARNVIGYAGGPQVVGAGSISAVILYYVDQAEMVGVSAMAEGAGGDIFGMFIQAETVAYFDPALTFSRPRIFDAQIRALGNGTSNTLGMVVWGAAPLLGRATIEARSPDALSTVTALDVTSIDYTVSQQLSVQGPFEIHDSTFVQAHPGTFRGLGIHANGADMRLDNVRVEARDFPLEVGVYQDLTNPARSVTARSSTFVTERPTQAGSVAVHPNASFRSIHGTFNAGVGLGTNASATCAASVYDAATPVFLASACP